MAINATNEEDREIFLNALFLINADTEINEISERLWLIGNE